MCIHWLPIIYRLCLKVQKYDYFVVLQAIFVPINILCVDYIRGIQVVKIRLIFKLSLLPLNFGLKAATFTIL